MAWCKHDEIRKDCRKCNPGLDAKDRALPLQKGGRPSPLVMRVGDSPSRTIEKLLREARQRERKERARKLELLAEVLPEVVYMTDLGIALHASKACLEEAQMRAAEKGLRPAGIMTRSPLLALRKKKRPCLKCLPMDSVDGLSEEMEKLWQTLIEEIPPSQGLLFQ